MEGRELALAAIHPPRAGEASIPDSIHLNYKLKELTHAAATGRLPSSLSPASATLEKARALHVVQDAPAILVLDDHVGDRLYVVMYVLISVSYIFLAN